MKDALFFENVQRGERSLRAYGFQSLGWEYGIFQKTKKFLLCPGFSAKILEVITGVPLDAVMRHHERLGGKEEMSNGCNAVNCTGIPKKRCP